MVADGYRFVLPPLLLAGVAIWFDWFWLGGVLLLLVLSIVYFFRDPERTPPAEPDIVVSPADGHVVEIVEEAWEGRPGQRISIFLAVWDVHVQRAPVAGRITKVEYRPGKFFVASKQEASQQNEQNVIHMETSRGPMVWKQIAGLIARRVLCWRSPGDTVALGERMGMIRFGSRCDVWLPPEAEIAVQRGQFVAGGTSILARWKGAAG